MELLPLDVIKIITRYLNWKGTINLLKINKRYNLLDNDKFWREKMEMNFSPEYILPLIFDLNKLNYLNAEQRKVSDDEFCDMVNYSIVKTNYLKKHYNHKFRLIIYDCNYNFDNDDVRIDMNWLWRDIRTLELKEYDIVLVTNKYKTDYIWRVFFMPTNDIDDIECGYQSDMCRGYKIKTKEFLAPPNFKILLDKYNINLEGINNLYLSDSKYQFDYIKFADFFNSKYFIAEKI